MWSNNSTICAVTGWGTTTRKSVITKNSALLSYSDLLSYDSTEHKFAISDKAMEIIINLKPGSASGLPFAVKANDTLIYTGYFWPGYSSLSCNWIVIDPVMTNIEKKMKVNLGYPGLFQGDFIPDKRNDPRIIKIFKMDRKLK